MAITSSEDYLRAMYELQEEEGEAWVSVTALAKSFQLPKASVVKAIERLAAWFPDLVLWDPERGCSLTAAGREAAAEVIEYEKRVERLLMELPEPVWDSLMSGVHRSDFTISTAMIERPGVPTQYEQGFAPQTAVRERHATSTASGIPLSQLEAGMTATVLRVTGNDPALLRYTAALGLSRDTTIEVIARNGTNGRLQVRLPETNMSYLLGREVAERVLVTDQRR